MEYKKNFLWNIIGASANAFVSLFLVIIVTRINGLNDAGIFSYCFATACLLYCVGVYSGRIFQVTDANAEISDYNFIHNKIITCGIMLIISFLFAFLNPTHSFYKATIMIILCGFKSIEAFSEVLYGIIQKRNELYKVGLSMTIKAVLSIILFLVVDILTQNLILSCLSIVLSNTIIMCTYDYNNIKKIGIAKEKFNGKANKVIFLTGFFTFLLAFLSIYVINIPRYTINNILTDDLQTIFGIIIMPATFMGLLGQFIIQPFLVKIKDLVQRNDYSSLSKMVIKITCAIIVLSIIILVIAYFLAIPVLEFIYGINLSNYKIAFMIILFGAVFYSLTVIFSAILVAMRKTLSQAIIYIIVSILGTLVSYPLVRELNISGASITYLITMFSLCISFITIIYINLYYVKRKRLEI